MRSAVTWLNKADAALQFRKRLSAKLINDSTKPSSTSCAVFIPVCYRDEKLSLLYTKRTDTLSVHKGQISFPGGRCEEGETAPLTSQREMKEEIGIKPLEVWGCLPAPFISLQMENVYACVGFIGHFEDQKFQICEDEVSHIFSIPVSDLIEQRREKMYKNQGSPQIWDVVASRIENDKDANSTERAQGIRNLGRVKEYKMPIFPSPWPTDPIWGLTAIITDGLLYNVFKHDGYPKHNMLASPLPPE